jgi:uncharacterized protein YuzE
MFQNISAERFAKQAAGELRASSEQARSRTPGTELDLTPQEARVAQLAGASWPRSPTSLADSTVWRYPSQADAAYIYLTGEPFTPGRDSVVCDLPDGRGDVTVIMDWKDGKIVGMEVLTASSVLHADRLA